MQSRHCTLKWLMLLIVVQTAVALVVTSRWLPKDLQSKTFYSNQTTIHGNPQIVMLTNLTHWQGEIQCPIQSGDIDTWDEAAIRNSITSAANIQTAQCQATPPVPIYIVIVRCSDVPAVITCATERNETVRGLNGEIRYVSTKFCKERTFDLAACSIEFYDSFTLSVASWYLFGILVALAVTALAIWFIGSLGIAICEAPKAIYNGCPQLLK